MDSKLFDRQGHEIGKIKDVVLDGRSGEAIYAAVSWKENDKRLTMVPWRLVRQSKSDKAGYVFQVDPEKARSATSFSPDKWPNLDDAGWNRSIYDYYGLRPYFWNGLK